MGEVAVSGFTIVRNAVKYLYPVEAALRSIAPLCDEIVVNVGGSQDETLDLVHAIGDPKIRILEAEWGDPAERGAAIYSIETNRALDACRGDWCFYIQADEVLHEDGLPRVRAALERHGEDPGVEALVFDYLHFYGSFDWVGVGRGWYRQEVRVVRKSSGIRSVRDAQGFRVNGRKPRAAHSGARIFHYGWSKPAAVAFEKRLQWYELQHDPDGRSRPTHPFRRLPGLRRFTGTHPVVIRDWIRRHNWAFDPADYPRDWSRKSVKRMLANAVERVTGWRPFERQNFRWVRPGRSGR